MADVEVGAVPGSKSSTPSQIFGGPLNLASRDTDDQRGTEEFELEDLVHALRRNCRLLGSDWEGF